MSLEAIVGDARRESNDHNLDHIVHMAEVSQQSLTELHKLETDK